VLAKAPSLRANFASASSQRLMLAFLVSAAIYIEGHGIHTACTIFKDPLKVYASRLC
jgi:hypothetical protein